MPSIRAIFLSLQKIVSGRGLLRFVFYRVLTQATYNRYARVSKAGSTLAQAIAPASSTERCGLERVLLTSYDVEIDWIESLFPANVPVTYIGNPPRGDSRTDPSVPSPGFYASDTMPNWEMCIPKKPHPRALQHMKLLLLYYSTHLRVIVSTANLTQLDWSRYENVRTLETHTRCCMFKIFLQIRTHLLKSKHLILHAAVLIFLYSYSVCCTPLLCPTIMQHSPFSTIMISIMLQHTWWQAGLGIVTRGL